VSLEENKAVVRKFIEATNKHDLSIINDLVAPNYVNRTKEYAIKGAIEATEMLFKGVPDFHVTIEDLIAEGDKVCARLKITGTHTGEYLGLAPTDKKITVRVVDIWRIVDGKLVEGWTDFNFYRDDLDLYRQLGVIKYTEKGKKLFPESVS
jgi:C-1 hydroxylase